MSKSLKDITAEVLAIFQEYDSTGTKTWTPEIAAKDLPYQVGTLSKLFLQRAGERYAEGQSETELNLKIADELADILAEILFIAHHLEIDMETALENMYSSDKKKISSRQQHAV